MTEHPHDDADPRPEVEIEVPEQAGAEEPVAEAPAAEETGEPSPQEPSGERTRPRRDRRAAALIGVLTLLLGFALAVQVRSTENGSQLTSAREEDLVGTLDELGAKADRLRVQIAAQRAALDELTSTDSASTSALAEARTRAQAIGILNGTIAAQGPGVRITIRDPHADAVRVADLLDAIEELRGAGAETMQVDGVRVGVSTAVTGAAGALRLDGHPISAPYEVLAIGSPGGLQTALQIPGGVVARITGQGGSVDTTQEQQVVVDALRPLDRPQYAAAQPGG